MENIFVVLKKALRSPKIVCHLKHSSSSEAVDLLCSLYNFSQIYYVITAVFMLFQCQQFYYKPPFLHTSVITQKTWVKRGSALAFYSPKRVCFVPFLLGRAWLGALLEGGSQRDLSPSLWRGNQGLL